jgi:PAS domain S-box-containing protein
MFKRPRFWLGLLLGSFAAFGSLIGSQKRRSAHAQAAFPKAIFDLSPDALIIANNAGEITHANAAAHELFGPQYAGLAKLCYPNGQQVPPGQLPIKRVLRTGTHMAGEGYRGTATDGSVCILDVSARPLPGGGAAVIFRDVTTLHGSQAREAQAQARQETMQQLGRRLSEAVTTEAAGRIVVESARALLGGMAQARLYGYDPAAQTGTRIASDPDDRPKRPQSAAQARLPTFPFDACVPALWQLYIDRQAVAASCAELGEETARAAYALPLLAGGAAIGHLALASSVSGAFEDPARVQALDVLVCLAALALTRPQAAERTAVLTAQADAVREIACAAAVGTEPNSLADLVSGHVRRVIACDICTLSVPMDGKLSILGKAFQDDLLFPGRISSADLALHGKAVQKAWRTQKNVTQLAIKNPSFETGPWRAFAGKSGRHSVLALPLASQLGVLTVYTDGDSPLPDAQVKFLETLAALASAALRPASVPEVRADC